MYINKIIIKNFRLYKNVNIDFNSANNKNIAIIIGDNGKGKTTFLNAIAWCLYGKESNTSKNIGLSLINNIAKNDKENEIRVSIIMTDKQKNKFEIVRTLNDTSNRSQFYILYKAEDSKEYEPILDTENFIEKHFPESIMHYFLFDGEMLEEYFQNDNEKIKKEVYNLSNIELLDRINKHINSVLTDIKYRVRNKNIIGTNKIDAEIEQINQSIDEQNKLLEKQKGALKIAKDNRDDLRKKLQGIPSISDKEELIEAYENELKNIKRDREGIELELYSTLIKEAPYIITMKESKEITADLSNKIDKGEIPPMYKKDFLINILDKNVCICGRDLDVDSRNLLTQLYKNTNEETNNSDSLSVLYHTLNDFDSHINSFRDTMQNLHDKDTKLESKFTTTSRNMEKIQKEIDGYDNEQIKTWQRELKGYDMEIENGNMKMGEIQNTINQFNKQLESKQKEYTEALKSNKETEGYRNEISFINKITDAVKLSKDSITNNMKKQIEKTTNDIFLEIIEKQQTFKEVNISDNYSFSVKDINNEECLGTLSAGERESLALSFIAALNDITEIDVPIIADTLLGRLDPDVKENIANVFHSIFTGTQLILLVTESEFSEKFKDKIKDKCSGIFKLIYNEFINGAYTEVISVE
jgi:DNA sulfur modification protein DndD